jgi:hypothetical protein
LIPPPEPDRLEKFVRFGCGSAAGAVIGLAACAQISDAPDWRWLLAIGAAAIVCGFLALRFGDDSWRALLKW